ncbi:hypothetical protein [Caballeronia sp. GAWG1-1]|uniref:hypothetical protein n=1 Tax=Caballeronia sp. GAWG1-1 TaxID=2921742 RepID=UPI0020295B01|nr:hypothetical protein [Caballeronia sp. GAWG1-1]
MRAIDARIIDGLHGRRAVTQIVQIDTTTRENRRIGEIVYLAMLRVAIIRPSRSTSACREYRIEDARWWRNIFARGSAHLQRVEVLHQQLLELE